MTTTDPHKYKLPVPLVRWTSRLLLLLLLVGVGYSCLIVILSLEDRPGANMVLMGLPMVAAPMIGVALLLWALTAAWQADFSRGELFATRATCIACGAPFLFLFVAG